ncbi:MAG: hypothetical protein HYX36_11960 [Rhizobiales bacterium]|nr:hypothetical protein [Hyphomicrobiales bacterium]
MRELFQRLADADAVRKAAAEANGATDINGPEKGGLLTNPFGHGYYYKETNPASGRPDGLDSPVSLSPTTPSTNKTDPTLDDFRDNASHNTGTASGRGTTGDVYGDNDARHNGGGGKSGQSTAGGQTGSTSTNSNHADKIEGGGDNGHQGGDTRMEGSGAAHGNYDKPDTSLKGHNGLLGGGVPILLDLTGITVTVHSIHGYPSCPSHGLGAFGAQIMPPA